jgi:predicted membrane channel-forming protein YqfA (hemolysin III family)
MVASNNTDQKYRKLNLARNAIFYLFLIVILINVISYLFFDYYLPSTYSALSTYLLYGFLLAGIAIQSSFYILFRKTGQRSEFLEERGVIFGAVLIISTIGFLLLEML